MASIQGSVGKNSKNSAIDVAIVQHLLNKFIVPGRLLIPALVPDGSCGKKTIAAIKSFQGLFLGFKSPDGRVDPGGQTLAALNGDVNQPQKGDPNEETRQSVMSVLKTLPSFKFTMDDITIRSEDIVEIGGLVAQRRIDIQYEPLLAEGGEYQHEPNLMILGFQKATSALRRSVVVHEAVHAVLDKRAQIVKVRYSEAVAFIAQGAYFWAQNRRHISEIGHPAMSTVLMHAVNLGIQTMAKEELKFDDIQSLFKSMSKVPGYDTPNVFAYDGI